MQAVQKLFLYEIVTKLKYGKLCVRQQAILKQYGIDQNRTEFQILSKSWDNLTLLIPL